MGITEFSLILKVAGSLGIGIFATHDIPVGTKIVCFPEGYEHRVMHKKDIPAEFLKYCIAKTDDLWLCPHRFDHMEIAWYMNHSDSPNTRKIAEGVCVVIREIKEGDQVTIDYNDLDEPEHLKEDFYKK